MSPGLHEPAALSADAAFEQRFARVEGLLAELSRATDPMLERATREVLSTVLELHRRGLERVLEIAAREESVREALARDGRVSAMLLLHGLHPVSLEDRVSRMVDTLGERFRSKLQNIEFEVRGAIVTVRVAPTTSACGSTRQALQKDINEALLSAVPDAESLVVELKEPAPALVTLRLRRDADSTERAGDSR
ncbi:MAG TPA: hypothetical protein VHW01_01905 [Polyangiaceae bacterium]|nr:hypothetical protein [Polyangiaceae bacterium]